LLHSRRPYCRYAECDRIHEDGGATTRTEAPPWIENTIPRPPNDAERHTGCAQLDQCKTDQKTGWTCRQHDHRARVGGHATYRCGPLDAPIWWPQSVLRRRADPTGTIAAACRHLPTIRKSRNSSPKRRPLPAATRPSACGPTLQAHPGHAYEAAEAAPGLPHPPQPTAGPSASIANLARLVGKSVTFTHVANQSMSLIPRGRNLTR